MTRKQRKAAAVALLRWILRWVAGSEDAKAPGARPNLGTSAIINLSDVADVHWSHTLAFMGRWHLESDEMRRLAVVLDARFKAAALKVS